MGKLNVEVIVSLGIAAIMCTYVGFGESRLKASV
jgi:hypothetical protein